MEIAIDIQPETPQIVINGGVVSFKEGVARIMEHKNWSRDDMAHYLKVSRRTVDGWLGGRKPTNAVLMTLSFMVQ